jgi:hypothetical protein
MLLSACALVCAVVAFGFAGSGWASLLYRLVFDGSILLIWLACATGVGAMILLALPLRPRDAESGDDEALLHVVTAAALGIGVFSLATLGLGLIGWLNRATTIGLLFAGGSLGGFALIRSQPWGNRQATGAWLRAPAPGWSWLWLAAMPFLGLALVTALLPPGVMWPDEPHGYDVVEYHLQIPREWYELGRIVPLRHNAFSLFPFNVEMHYLLAMHLRGGPWAGMYLAHYMHLAMVVLAIPAVYGFARQLRPSRAAATIASVAVATVPWLTQLGTIAYNEGGLLLFGTLAMGWAFRAAVEPSRRLGRFPVAGLLAGFACGSKLTGVPEVLLAVGGLSVLGVLLTGKGTARISAQPASNSEDRSPDILAVPFPVPDVAPVPLTLRLIGVATFFLAGLLTFAPWLVRNQIWAGNPIFPEAAGVLGKGHFSDAQVDRWHQAHSPRPDQRSAGARLKAWWQDVWASPQYGYLLLPLGLAAGVIALFPRARRRTSEDSDIPQNVAWSAFLLIGMFVALSVIWLGFTHLQGRFFILAVPVAGIMLSSMPWGRAAGAGAAMVLVAALAGFARLHSAVTQRLDGQDISILLGFEQLPAAFAPEAAAQVPPDAPLALAGDARAFVYAGPMSRLHYRTVFDVDVKPGQSVIDAWVEGAPADAWVLVDPAELDRFHRTYKGMPALPEEYARRAGPFVLTPEERKTAGKPAR